jgi:membrane protein YdbS with pleckstrin-like domain
MDCPRCLTAIDPDSRFCKHCGATIQTYSEKIALAPKQQPPTAPAPAPQPDSPPSPSQERSVWEGRAAWRSFSGSWLLWLAAACILIWAVFQFAAPTSFFRRGVWAIILAGAAGLAIREFLFVYGVKYRLTSQRLFVDRGILSRVTDQLELVRVDDVRIRQSLVGRILNTGDVEVFAADTSDESILLESIDRPNEIAEALRVHVRAARGKQTLFVENV